MKKRLLIMSVIITVLALMTLPGCKNANETVEGLPGATGTWFGER